MVVQSHCGMEETVRATLAAWQCRLAAIRKLLQDYYRVGRTRLVSNSVISQSGSVDG